MGGLRRSRRRGCGWVGGWGVSGGGEDVACESPGAHGVTHIGPCVESASMALWSWMNSSLRFGKNWGSVSNLSADMFISSSVAGGAVGTRQGSPAENETVK